MQTITFCDAFTQKARRKIFPAADTLLFITDSLVLVTAVTSTCCVPHSFPVVIVGLLLLAGVAHLRSRYTDTAHIHSVLPGQRQHDCVSSWLTSFRALMMLTTCIVIFAVDLPIFPKESAKSIKYGFTLMDLGVGAMTYAAGFVTGLQHRSTNSSLFSSGILMLLLGLFRLILVKMADYHEQVIEYGVHWNFFFSLGAMFLLHSLFVIFDALDEVVWGAAVVVLGFANHFLFHTYDFAEFVFEAPRTNIFSQNREGFFGLIGFVILFQLAYRAGRTTLLCAEDAPRFFPRWCLAALVGFISVTQSGISSSRRLVSSVKPNYHVLFTFSWSFFIIIFEENNEGLSLCRFFSFLSSFCLEVKIDCIINSTSFGIAFLHSFLYVWKFSGLLQNR